VTAKKNGWLKVAGVIVSLIVGLLAIWTFVKSGVAGGAIRENKQEMRLDACDKINVDVECRMRATEKSLNEQRPIWRAVARKLNVELPCDSAGP